MKEKITAAAEERLKELGVFIDNVEYGKVNGENTLTIVLDSEEIIPLNTVVMATRILNPILDKLDLIDESYMLDAVSYTHLDVYKRQVED